jgi:NADH:ubiquinone oxidoreductase subunit F (NADH-binding)
MRTPQAPTTATPPAVLPRLLEQIGQPGRAATLAEHVARHGHIPYRGGSDALISTIEQAGLTGRGGAAFPTARKMRAVAEGKKAVVVGNGAEGEPAAWKDRALLTTNPHLVLDGLQLAAEALDASKVYLYLQDDSLVGASIDRAIDERRASRVDHIDVEVVTAPTRFISGEESALSNRVSGGPAKPRFTPPRVFERGVKNRPTLVQNVETLGHIGLIGRYGAEWFRQAGPAEDPGTMLCSISGVVSPVVLEAQRGASIAAVLERAGVDADEVGAVLIGGYHGAWLSREEAWSLSLVNSELKPRGAAVGAGVLVAFPKDRCGLHEAARVVDYLAGESAQQCGPCMFGLPALADTMHHLASPQGAHRGTVDEIARLGTLVERRGACHHPDGSMRFVRSAMRVFAPEIALHATGRCSGTSTRQVLPIHEAPQRPADWK